MASQSPNQPQPPDAAPAVLVVMPPAEPEPPPAPIWSPWGLIPTWGSLFMAAAKWWPGGSHRFISLPAKRCKASRYSTFGQEHGPFGDIFSWKSSFKAASPRRESVLLHPMFAGILNTHPRPTPKLFALAKPKPRRTSPQLHRSNAMSISKCNHLLLSSPSERLKSQLKDNIPCRCAF